MHQTVSTTPTKQPFILGDYKEDPVLYPLPVSKSKLVPLWDEPFGQYEYDKAVEGAILQRCSPGKGRALKAEEDSSSTSTAIEEREIELSRKERNKVGAGVWEERAVGLKPEEVKKRIRVVSQRE